MDKKTIGGLGVILSALLLSAYNMADLIGDLKDWHGIVNPSFIGPALKCFASTILSAFGGALLPQIGRTN